MRSVEDLKVGRRAFGSSPISDLKALDILLLRDRRGLKNSDKEKGSNSCPSIS
jgi:hypothetical protein